MSLAVNSISRLFSAASQPFSRGIAARDVSPAISTGVPEADALLGGGFPKGEMTEILCADPGRGELRLLFPALRAARHACWILRSASDFEPYAPALEAAGIDAAEQLFAVPASPEEAFWCAEHAASSGGADLIVAWLPPLSPRQDYLAMQRVQMAAHAAGATVFAFRPYVMSGASSPAKLRVQITPKNGALAMRAALEGGLFGRSAAIAPAAAPARPARHAPQRPLTSADQLTLAFA
jgi:protein ImuA